MTMRHETFCDDNYSNSTWNKLPCSLVVNIRVSSIFFLSYIGLFNVLGIVQV